MAERTSQSWKAWEILGPRRPLGDADELCGWVSVRGIFSGQQCPRAVDLTCTPAVVPGREVPREQARGLLLGGLVVESVWVVGPMRVTPSQPHPREPSLFIGHPSSLTEHSLTSLDQLESVFLEGSPQLSPSRSDEVWS